MLVRRHPVTTFKVLAKKVVHVVRHRTVDRDVSPVLTVERIGPKRYKTPEGYLYCEAVPAARVSTMTYAASELPLEAGPDGVIRVERDATALFAPSTLASYNGKPLVEEHPDDVNLSSDNYDDLGRQIIGTVLNPRRGEGEDADVMLVDLLIMSKAAIKAIEGGKVEVSAGYEADYEELGPGRARQFNIIGNHVALVDRGRCGPRCAIGDHQPKELRSMGTNNRRALLVEKARAIFKDAEDGLVSTMEDMGGMGGDADDDDDNGTHIHIHTGAGGGMSTPPGGATGDPSNPDVPRVPTQDDPTEARFQGIEKTLAAICSKLGIQAEGAAPAEPTGDGGAAVPAGTPTETDAPAGGDAMAGADDDVRTEDAMPDELDTLKKVKTGDSAAFETMWRQVVADAEVLVPGFRVPTFDSKSTRRRTVDAVCVLRRQVLQHLTNTSDFLKLAGAAYNPSANCAAVAASFRAAATARRIINNGAATHDAERVPVPGQLLASRKPMTPAELNKLHREFYGQAH